jgi:hypothetical protein
MFKRRKMRFNGEWSLLAGNRVYELTDTIDLVHFYDILSAENAGNAIPSNRSALNYKVKVNTFALKN